MEGFKQEMCFASFSSAIHRYLTANAHTDESQSSTEPAMTVSLVVSLNYIHKTLIFQVHMYDKISRFHYLEMSID